MYVAYIIMHIDKYMYMCCKHLQMVMNMFDKKSGNVAL